MYACGDASNPASDTVNVMEEILIEYIEQLVSIHNLDRRGPFSPSYISCVLFHLPGRQLKQYVVSQNHD